MIACGTSYHSAIASRWSLAFSLFYLILAQSPLNHNFLCVSLSFVHNIWQATAGGTDGVASDGRSCLRLSGPEHPCLQVLQNC